MLNEIQILCSNIHSVCYTCSMQFCCVIMFYFSIWSNIVYLETKTKFILLFAYLLLLSCIFVFIYRYLFFLFHFFYLNKNCSMTCFSKRTQSVPFKWILYFFTFVVTFIFQTHKFWNIGSIFDYFKRFNLHPGFENCFY